jgi:hypothetical protein
VSILILEYMRKEGRGGGGTGKGEMEGGGKIADHLKMDPFPSSFLHEPKAEVNHSNYYYSNLQNMQLSYGKKTAMYIP